MKTRLSISLLSLGLAFVLSQHLFYEPFIVPRLTSWHAVPVYWWGLAFIPEVAVCVVVALISRTTKEWGLFCLLGALVVTTLQWVEAVLHRPGTHKLIEGGVGHFVFQGFILFILLFCTVGLVRVIRYVSRYQKPAS